MPRVVHFELPADDPQRAVGFYEKVFGWTITKWEGPFDYWLVTTGSDDELGINGAITPRMVPEQVTTDTIGVECVDNSLKRLWKREVPSRSQKKLFQALDMLPTALTQKGTCLVSYSPTCLRNSGS